jgi:hypothetical protein
MRSRRTDAAGIERDALEATRHLAIVARRRADRRAYRVVPNRLPALLADQRVVLSGTDAGQHHGAPVRPGDPHPVYVSRAELDQLVVDHRRRDDGADSNVIVRVVDPDVWILHESPRRSSLRSMRSTTATPAPPRRSSATAGRAGGRLRPPTRGRRYVRESVSPSFTVTSKWRVE